MSKKTTDQVQEKITKKITSLTPEQEALIPVYREKYREIGLSTEPTNRAEAEKALTEAQLYLGNPKPEFVWARDPFEGAKLAAQYAKGDANVTIAEIREQTSKASYGSFEALWVSFYAFIAEVLPVKKDNLHEIVTRIVKNCGVYWTFEGLIVATDKPTKIKMLDNKLHCTDGLALEYSSGRGVYAINGERKANLMEVLLHGKFDEQKSDKGQESVTK